MSTLVNKRRLLVEEVAHRYNTTPRGIHGKTGKLLIPHIKRVGFRPLLFDEEELDRWDAGAELEVIYTADGSRIVRTVREEL